MRENSVLSVQNLHVVYSALRGTVKAVRDVSFELNKKECLAFIGESGSGKSTLGTSLISLIPGTGRVSSGKIIYRGNSKDIDIAKLSENEVRKIRWKEIAMVFQSALNSFNPVLRIWNHILETAKAHGVNDKEFVQKKSLELLELVQLDPERVLKSFPHELSGGMKQRTLIAMSLLLDPKILILDEPTTALDILTQKNIIELLKKIKDELELAMIFISHDLSIAAELADRVATMYGGKIVEIGPTDDIFYRPKHPYTKGLLKAVPKISGGFEELFSIPGEPPDLINPPSGCPFHPRCGYVEEVCKKEAPQLEQVEGNHYVACYKWRGITDGE
ncbi:MAG: peptide/nickel transport system ATP-binding protein [Thermotogaceae bacterium]|jgi:peptide/nickel transport system ATP-binding protein|nr:peptide/nickel transport system ATP-binding protein [Thermotogaceae bacterium]MDN5338857.1 peptide/nickel transport system ATP-binding protein [Thermotogaceae bacterium]